QRAGPRSRFADRWARPAAANGERESGTKPSGPGDEPHRSPATGTGGWRASRTQLSDSVPPSRLRREASPALAAATLQNRPAGLRGHARAEAVLALAATDIGLVGAFHDCRKDSSLPEKAPRRSGAGGQYRRASSTAFSTGADG